MFHQYNIFSVPVYRQDCNSSVLNQQEVIKYFKEYELNDDTDYTGKYPVGSYTSYHNNDSILELPQLDDLKTLIKDTVQSIHFSVGLSGTVEFTNSWFSINRKFSYHETHNHCPDIWSGVYYVQAEEGDATISFLNRLMVDSGWPYSAQKTAHTDFVSNKVTCPVKTGMLIVFPSYLDHMVDQHLTDNERITIAFNLNVK